MRRAIPDIRQLRGPAWKEERDDPWHRRPPLEYRRFPRRGSGSIQAANGGGQRRGTARELREDGDRQRVTDAVGCPNRPPLPAATGGDGDADGARAFGSKLKAAGSRHGEPRDFRDNSAEPAMPQDFLETDEDRLLISRST